MADQVRIKDIAKRAGVSAGTVDRVLHERGELKAETKELVLKIASELNYKPNVAAQLLKKSFGYKVAILIPKPTNKKSYWSKHPKGFQNTARKKSPYNIDFNFFQFSLNNENDFVKKTHELVATKPDGVVLAPLYKKESIAFCKQLDGLNIPYVFIDTSIEGVNNLSYTGEDSIKSSRTAASLIDTTSDQNKDILIVNISKDLINSPHLNSRNKGFEEYFNENRISKRQKITVNVSSNSMAEVKRKLDSIFSANKNIGAVFVTSSRVYLVADYLKQQKIKVRLVGYDLIEENIRFLNAGIIDFLISQRPVHQAEKAMEIITDFLIDNKSVIQKSYYQPIDIVNKESLFSS